MKIPDRIWLQYHGDADPADYPDGPEPSPDEVTWCWEPIWEHDIEYVRADHIEALEAERDGLREALQGLVDWWLRDGRNHFNGAPAEIFNARAALNAMENWKGESDVKSQR